MSAASEEPRERRHAELLAVVYGRDGEPGVDVVAELAALERELAARQGDARRGATPASTAPPQALAHGPADAAVPAGATVAGGHLEGPLRRFRGVAIASVVLMLIAAGFALIGPVRATLSPARGLEVFDRPPTAEEFVRADQVAAAAGMKAGYAETLRSVGRLLGHEFWVHRDARGRVCLLSKREFWFDWIDECSSLARFREVGVTRRIVGDDIRDESRPPRIRPDDVVIVRWGPWSLDVEWEVEPASSTAS